MAGGNFRTQACISLILWPYRIANEHLARHANTSANESDPTMSIWSSGNFHKAVELSMASVVPNNASVVVARVAIRQQDFALILD